jgi:hypothetical protein
MPASETLHMKGLMHCTNFEKKKPYYQHPHLWHSRAGEGAVHSIASGLMDCNMIGGLNA